MQTISQGRQRVARERACVLFDTKTGAIRHIQHVIVMEGGYDPKDHEVEAMCRDALRKRGHAHDGTAMLHVARDAFKLFKAYKVDLARKALIEETPRRKR